MAPKADRIRAWRVPVRAKVVVFARNAEDAAMRATRLVKEAEGRSVTYADEAGYVEVAWTRHYGGNWQPPRAPDKDDEAPEHDSFGG